MMKETLKSYKSDNRGSAIITGLVVSTVLMVLCLSLLLVAYSFFISTYKSTSDLPNREMLYSAAEALEHELTEYTLEYEEGAEPTLPADHALWNYVYTNIWQGFDPVAGKEGVYAQDESNGYWLYFNENDPSANHKDIEKCSRYFNLSSLGNVKIVVQLYWQLPNGTDVNAINTDNKNGTLLNAIYRMYDNKGNVMVKSKRAYKLSYGLDTTSSGSGSSGSGSGSGIGSNMTFEPIDQNDRDIHPISPEVDDGLIIQFQKNGSGHADLIVYNNSDKTVDNWKFFFISQENILVNDASYLTDIGNGIYAVQNLNWNGNIQPHQSRIIGFHNDFKFIPRAIVVEEIMQPLPSSDFEWKIESINNTPNLIITNKSGKTIKSWNFEFDCDKDIYSIGKVVSDFKKGNGHFVLVPTDNEGAKEIKNGDSVILPLNVESGFTTIENVVFKTFSLTALEDLNQTVVNIVKYKWNRIGEDIINPGGGN